MAGKPVRYRFWRLSLSSRSGSGVLLERKSGGGNCGGGPAGSPSAPWAAPAPPHNAAPSRRDNRLGVPALAGITAGNASGLKAASRRPEQREDSHLRTNRRAVPSTTPSGRLK